MTDADSVRAAAEMIGREFGRLDVLVNNAGVATGYHKPSEETADDLRSVYETNVFAVVSVTNAFLPWLLSAPAARIVNITSKRLAGTAVRVNGAAPGHVATDFNGFRGTRTPEQGAAIALRLAALGEDGPTGGVFAL